MNQNMSKLLNALDKRTNRSINSLGSVVHIGTVISLLPDLRIQVNDMADKFILSHKSGHLLLAIEEPLYEDDLVVMLPTPGKQTYIVMARVRKEFIPQIVSDEIVTTGTVNIDFESTPFRNIGPLTGDIVFTTSNRSIGKAISLRIQNGGTLRTFTFPSWVFLGVGAPANIAANKMGILSLSCFGPEDTDIVAAYGLQA
jgi:hypothetical protein